MTPSASARPFLQARAGTTAVEFALLAPVLILFLTGVFLVSLAYYQAATVQWSLERSVRQAMIDESCDAETIKALMADDLKRIGSPAVEITYTRDDSADAPLAVIRAVYTIPLKIPFLPEQALRYTAEDVAPIPVG